MSNIIDSIQVSGTVYQIQGSGGGNPTVELTQAQYDALVDKDPDVFYIITDAEAVDIDNYYTKSQTSGATQISTALNAKQDTLVAGDNITISGNVISAEGGGASYQAGTNISIANDTINCTLPIFVHSNSGRGDIRIGTDINADSDYYRLGIGRRIDMSSTNGTGSIAIGVATTSSSQINKCYGDSNVAIGRYFQVGESNTSSGVRGECVVIGNKAKSLIDNGVAIGSEATVSGTTKTNINNQLKIDTSNQVYIYNKDNTEMICLQDQLGGGSSYTAGDGIDITNDVISVTGKVDTTAITTSMSSASTDSQVPSAKAVYDQFGGLKLVKLTQQEYNALTTKDSNTLYIING